MVYLIDEVAEEGQTVRGCIIALDDDLRIKRALRMAPYIDFYQYEVKFSLNKHYKVLSEMLAKGAARAFFNPSDRILSI